MILFKICNQIFNDPKASFLLNTAIKQNADTIIDKAEDRYNFFLSQIKEAREDDIEPDQSDIDKKNHTKNLKFIAENIKNNNSINIDTSVTLNDATNIFLLKGIETKIGLNSIE